MCSPVLAAPTNFFRPGEKNLNGQLADMGEGLLITELGGLHAGANPVSGDFSLIAKGFRVKDRKQDAPVEQVTIAGNFYQLQKISGQSEVIWNSRAAESVSLRGYRNHPCCRKMKFTTVSFA